MNKLEEIELLSEEVNLKHLDILSCRRYTLLSWLIRKATKSPVNHTAIVVSIKKKTFVIDSQKDGTHLRPYKYWVKKYKYKFINHRMNGLTNDQRDSIERRAMDVIGHRGYDVLSLIFYHPWYLLTGKWKGKTGDQAGHRLYCSEAVDYIVSGKLERQPSPDDLLKMYLKDEVKFRTTDRWKILEKKP